MVKKYIKINVVVYPELYLHRRKEMPFSLTMITQFTNSSKAGPDSSVDFFATL